MENNKLGIVIYTTKSNNRSSGFRDIYRFNSDGWSSVVRDTGAELKKVTNNTASAPIHFIQFENNGCCYCIMQSIGGRKDYQSAWIFIHKDIILPKGELSSIIKKVEEILSLDVEDNKVELDTLFEKTYPITNNPSYSASMGETYAVRYYGKGTDLMYDRSFVIEDYLYQSEYCKYKSVFLVDKDSNNIQVSDAEDLSNEKLEKSFVIELPEDIDGFKHNWKSNHIRVTNGSKVKVLWTKKGYAPINKEGKTTEELLINKSEYHRSFRLNLFRVVDKVSGKTLNARPEFKNVSGVDNQRNPTLVYFKEEDLNSIQCVVRIQTYEPFNGSLDLTRPNAKGEYVIELLPEQHIYECYIETAIPDARTIEFEINTQHRLKGTEIPGFQFEGTPSEQRKNRLKADSNYTYSHHSGNKAGTLLPIERTVDKNHEKRKDHHKKRAPWYLYALLERTVDKNHEKRKDHHKKRAPWYQYALLVILLCVVLGGVLFLIFWDDKVSTPPNVKANETVQQTEWDKALDYLKEHDKDTYWVKAEMESYSELKDVYTMIKDYKFKDLKSFIENHKDDLMQLEVWKRLYDKINTCNDKKGSFSAPNGKIEIEKYLNKDFNSMEDVQPEGGSSETTNSSTSQSTSTQQTTSQTGHGSNASSGNNSNHSNQNRSQNTGGNSGSNSSSNSGNNQDNNV